MDEFLKMDIFFVVTTVVVVVLGVFVAFALWRLQRVLKNVEHVSKNIALESDLVHEDIAELRSSIRKGKGPLKALAGLVWKFIKRTSKKA
jgi:hypothetical protein